MKSSHKHCKCECEHPQQFTISMMLGMTTFTKEYCGKCYVLFGELCEMILCECD